MTTYTPRTWTVDCIPDQRGRVAVVTGANGGLGFATARELARKGAHVVLAVRRRERGVDACRRIEAAVPGAALDVQACDLASLRSVRECGDRIVSEFGRVDMLVNNAGVMGIPEQRTADGFEMQLGVNHLGHFVLTRRLLPALLASPAGRVVSVTSFGRFTARRVRPDDPHLHRHYNPWQAYGQSKIANVHFALELQRRLAGAGAIVQSLVAHPGLAHTELQLRSVRETRGGWSQRFWLAAASSIGVPPELGARPLLRAATDPSARGGELYGPRWGSFGPPVRRRLLPSSRRMRAARELWEVSERETGERFDVAEIVRG